MVKKKGVSPLIATILLLAFAVSLATLIYGVLLDTCKNYKITISDDNVCYDDKLGVIRVSLQNDMEYDIPETRVVLFPTMGDTVTKDFEENIPSGGIKQFELDYDKTFQGDIQKNKDGSLNMLIIPKYNVSNKIKECRAEIDVTDIPDCATAE